MTTIPRTDLADAFAYHWRISEITVDAPQPEREQCLIDGRKWRVDFVWRSQMLIVEIDGGQWKQGGGRHNTDNDKEKCNALTEAGYRILHYSGSQLENDPTSCIAQVVRIVSKAT
jgi:very-short-patch-repair endonuclease